MEFETSTKRYSENIETPTFTTLADFSTEFRTADFSVCGQTFSNGGDALS